MNIPTSQATRQRLGTFAQTDLFRYLLAGLGTAGIGLGASVLLRRPHRMLIGGGMIIAGAAMLVRGVRGAWPRIVVGDATRPYMPAVSAEAGVDESWGDNQGEGNRTAARNYSREVRQFMDDGRVEPAARSAARAVDGPEAGSLRAAEQKAKQSPSNGRH